MVCKRVHYRGTVQGVGFRATVRSLARRFAVAGFVRNLTDGRVEVVAEGQAEEVMHFLDAIGCRMEGYVTDQEVRDETPQGFADFAVRPTV